MESRDLSHCTLISRIMSHFETTGTVPNTHGISECRPTSVASTRRSSMLHGNPPLPGPNVPSPTLLYELSSADTPFQFDVELCKISFFFVTRILPDLYNLLHITNVHAAFVFDSWRKKRRRRGLKCLKMVDSGAPSVALEHLRPMMVCRCSYYECWEL